MPEQLQLLRNDDDSWTIVRWTMDDRLLGLAGTYRTKEGAKNARLKLLAAGNAVLYKPRGR